MNNFDITIESPKFVTEKVRFPTSYHNKAVIAEGFIPILPLRWEFFYFYSAIILMEVQRY